MKTATSVRVRAVGAGLVVLGAMAFTLAHRAPPRAESVADAPATEKTISRSTSPNRPAPARTTISVVAASAPACAFRKGDAAAWDLTDERTFALDLAAFGAAGQVAATPPGKSTIHAALQVEALGDSKADGAVLLARLTDVDAETTKTVGDLGAPFLLRVAPDCSIAAFAHRPGTPLVAARTQQAMTAELAFAVPASDVGSMSGEDGTGAYSATVARGEDGTFLRRLTGYGRLFDRSGASGNVDIDDSLLTVRPGRVWFTSMSGHALVHGHGVARAESKLTVVSRAVRPELLAGLSRHEADYVWEDLLPRKVKPLAEAETVETPQDRAAREELKTVTLANEVKRFSLIVDSTKDINAQSHELRLFFEAHPESIAKFASMLRARSIPTRALAPAYLALGRAKVPEARDALLHLNRDETAPSIDRAQAALLLAARKDVDLDFAKALHTDAKALLDRHRSVGEQNYARTAALALGMLAGLHGDGIHGAGDEARNMIHELLASASTPLEMSPAFGAMGNLGDPSELPEIERWSLDEDPHVRAVVPRALRRLPMDLIGGFVASWLAREDDQATKRELWDVVQKNVLDSHEPPSAALVAQALKDLRTQPELLERQSLVRLLGPVAKENPLVQAALLAQAKRELGQKNGVFDMIAQYVDGEALASALRPGEVSGLSSMPLPASPSSLPNLGGRP